MRSKCFPEFREERFFRDSQYIRPLQRVVENEFLGHMIEKVGEKANRNLRFYNTNAGATRMLKAVRGLVPEYDVGVVIANDGFDMGFVAERYGLPVLVTKMNRKTQGRKDWNSEGYWTDVEWNPIDEFSDRTIRDKRVIVFEGDIVTGATLKKAASEIERYGPKEMDLMLDLGHNCISFGDYQRFREAGLMRSDLSDYTNKTDYRFGDARLDTRPQADGLFGKIRSLDLDYPKEDWTKGYPVLEEFESSFEI